VPSAMTQPRDPNQQDAVHADLVEYLVVVVPGVDSLSTVATALADLVRGGTVRILDLVVVVRDAAGELETSEPDAIDGMAVLDELQLETGRWLSLHDIELSALALQPGTAGVIVVTEDRWAEPLSTAARLAGGRIVAGDRIPPQRVETVLAEHTDDVRTGE
jgi:Family of unknown function (DUF6325)